jgi:hypothetical protein
MANLVNGSQKVNTYKTAFLYDFAVDGGATGSLSTPVFIPANAQVRTRIATLTTVTSGGAATIDIQCGGQSILVTGATGKADIPTAGNYNGLNDVVATTANNATSGKVAVGGQVTLIIGGAAITAGKFFAVFEYDIMTAE